MLEILEMLIRKDEEIMVEREIRRNEEGRGGKKKGDEISGKMGMI